MKKKFVIAGSVAIALLLAFILFPKPNPVKNTRWYSDENSVLSFGSSSYEWHIDEDNSAEGKYKVYTGRKAKIFLDEYAEKYVKSLDKSISDDEKDGTKEEIKGFKNKIDAEHFVIEENLDSAIYDGQKIEPQNNVYFATRWDEKGIKHLCFENIRTYENIIFEEYQVSTAPEKLKFLEDNGSDEHLEFTYVLPAGYGKYESEPDHVVFATEYFDDNITVSVSEGSVKNILDEHPGCEKANDPVTGETYKCTEQHGCFVSYIVMFDHGNKMYQITSDKEAPLNDFVKSIKFK